MKYFVILTILFNCLAITIQANEAEEICKLKAQAMLKNLSNDNYNEAVNNFDSTMKAVMPADKLKEVWLQIRGQVGLLETIGETKVNVKDDFYETITPLKFKESPLFAKIYFNKKYQISGFFISLEGEKPPYIKPDYVDTTAIKSRQIKFGDSAFPLSGILSSPKGVGKFPVVILVHGSGPHDADETIGQNKPFADIAGGLATKGIAVFRFIKRTYAYGSSVDDGEITLDWEVIDDVLNAINVLTEQPEIDKESIFILGHSLGGMMLPRIAAKTNIPAGYISMAGTVRSFEDFIIQQVKYLFEIDGRMDRVEKGRLAELTNTVRYTFSDKLNSFSPKDSCLLNVHPNYWLDYKKYDYVKLAKAIDKPILIAQGERDYQVTPELNFEYWKLVLAGKSNVEYKLYPGLNHLFLMGEGKPNPGEYNTQGSVSLDFIIDLASFIYRYKAKQ